MSNTNVRVKIREIREEKNIPFRKLVEKTGISKATLWRYENGTRIPNLQSAYCIAYHLGCTLDELIEPVNKGEA